MEARFLASAPGWRNLPDFGHPEVAFVGRSNVGKSSLLGKVMQRNRLVRTSRTPGRTQALNAFLMDERLVLTDLPGYGYAKQSKTQREAMDKMVRGYVQHRARLRAVILVVDARRDPVSDYDRYVVRWVLEHDRPVLVTANKIDLVPKNRRGARMAAIEKQLEVPPESVLFCSAKEGDGLKTLRARLWEIAAQESLC